MVNIPGRLTRGEIEKLEREGVEISSQELRVLSNGTLAYKDSRVLVYIRDVFSYGDRENEPRYHLFNCSTLREMQAGGRFKRYVAATKLDGYFDLVFINSASQKPQSRRLDVCKNCLSQLAFDGYSQSMTSSQKTKFVAEFVPERFFSTYEKTLFTQLPDETEANARLNDYPIDWSKISFTSREKANWYCSDCKRDFSKLRHRVFLHVHHKDGLRWNCRIENLEVLCIGCHADRPQHKHLRHSPSYSEFRKNF